VIVQSFLSQLPALIGVVVGAVATYAVTVVTECSRWRREQKVRWDSLRVAAYAEYANALKHLISAVVRAAGTRGLHHGWDVAEVAQDQPGIAAAERERTTKWEAVLLLGSTEAVTAARTWHESVYRMQALATGSASDLTWDEAVAESSRARAEFYVVARRDLGISTSGPHEAFEWRFAKWAAIPPPEA
jgi:hypothetical protein